MTADSVVGTALIKLLVDRHVAVTSNCWDVQKPRRRVFL
jgi:hypothetical protein